MKAARIGAARNADGSLWPWARTVGRLLAYLGVPAATLPAIYGIFVTINVLTFLYLLALVGLVALFRGAKVDRSLLYITYFLAGWYVVLLAIELSHGGPFHYPLTRGANFLTDYFPLLAVPLFVIGLQETKPDFDVFRRVIAATIVFTAGVSLYQFLVLGIARPKALTFNPITLALVMMVLSLFLLSAALRSRKVDWPYLAVAVIGLVPILLSGSKNIWVCTALGYFILFFLWTWNARRWLPFAAVAVVVVALAWLLSRTNFVRSRLVEFGGDLGAFLAAGNTSGPTFGLRYAAISSGLLAFLDRPFLGYGLVHGKAAAMEHRPPTFTSIAGLNHLHNEYVTHLVAFGFPGLIFIAAFLALFVFMASRREDPALRRFGVVVGCVLAVYLMADVMFTLPEVYGLVFFILGLILLSPEKPATGVPAASAHLPPETAGSPAGARTGEGGLPASRVSTDNVPREPPSRWQWPAAPMLAFLAVLAVGLFGLGWSQRDISFRVAQTAVLSEQPDDPAHPGTIVADLDASVRWRFVAERPDEPEIIADFDIPATGAGLRLTIRKNTDPTLPASHIVEVMVTTPPDFPDKTVASIEGLRAKSAPGGKGLPMIGSVAEMGAGDFWIGLSPDPGDVATNLRLLAGSAFFDLPIIYKSGQHAVLTFEKGRTGQAVFQKGLPALAQ